MTTLYDIPAKILNPALAARLEESKSVSTPEWAEFVKTGADRERPPSQSNWWFLRSAAILRKVAREGPVGVTHLAQAFGGRKDNGAGPNTPGVASRHIIRTSLQQLEESGLVEKVPGRVVEDENGDALQLYKGRRITASGHKMIDAVAHECRPAANEQFPGLSKY
ncbi:40S ribosomal protein S19 [Candidatus Poseidoniaceae archaeon]|nr:40S ribosomal protein S19 [Candidatus Poseidoniaceae archaeon]